MDMDMDMGCAYVGAAYESYILVCVVSDREGSLMIARWGL